MKHSSSILVIDDEPTICESCQRILSQEDFHVDTDINPISGYKQALVNNYDLIILDLMMEDLDGMELLAKLRKKKPDVPVIIITGYPTHESKEKSKSLGVLYYILKPFEPSEIIEPIKNILEHSISSIGKKEALINYEKLVTVPKWESAEKHCRFFKSGWLQMGSDGSVRAGGYFPDFSDKTIESIRLPDVEGIIYRGMPLVKATLSNKNEYIIPSPVSGKIIEINDSLKTNLPVLVKNNYKQTWVARIIPDNIEKDLKTTVQHTIIVLSKERNKIKHLINKITDSGIVANNISSFNNAVKLINKDKIKVIGLDEESLSALIPYYVEILNKKFPGIKIIVFNGTESSTEILYNKNKIFHYTTHPVQDIEISDVLNKVFCIAKDKGMTPWPEITDRLDFAEGAGVKKTGIYFLSDTPDETPDYPDLSQVITYANEIPQVKAIWDSSDFTLGNTDFAAKKIKDNKLQRMIIAGNMPGHAKNFFTKAMIQASNDPEDLILVDFREYGIKDKLHTERARAILLCAAYGISLEEVNQPGENPVNSNTLIIGGGIAGIQASLEIANSGNKVYLVEKSATIGGHMATFDKTFPTLDCAACILTPKMVEVGQHPNVELMTYCTIRKVTGVPGNYKVSVLKKARRVDLKACTGCGNCALKCPSLVPSEFDSGTSLRKAIYIPFPQAVPNKYLIDSEHCRYVQNGKCGVCVKACPVENCINLDEKDEIIEISVGNIILATGFKPFDARRIEDYGYGKFPNVVTSLEFERLVNASGPTGGKITYRSQDKKGNWIFNPDSGEPGSVALIHCVGSRDRNYNNYCSRVCCMYSLKLAHLVKEKLPDASIYEYYIDMRAFGKGYEEFLRRIKHEGIQMIRGKTAKIEEAGSQLLLRSEDIMNNRLIEQKVDMVILAVGLEPGEDNPELSRILGVQTSEGGWFKERNNVFDPVNTDSGGITIAGVCQGPKDIPDTVAQASAAASRVIQSILIGKVKKNFYDFSIQKIESDIKKLSRLNIVSYERAY